MLFSTFAALALSTFAVAAPTKRAITDTEILQYALTLEHLENAFYSGALAKYSDADFDKAGLPAFARKRFVQIGEHEAAHVAFLQGAIGDSAVKACEYNFPYTDPASFAALAMILEGVGVSAYLGAAKDIVDKNYLTAAASVLTTEARHAAWVSSAVRKGAPWSGALDVPLGYNQVYSLASPFFTSCPSDNVQLPVKAFPPLALATKTYKAGDKIDLTYDNASDSQFLGLFTGLSTIFVPIKNKSATLPKELAGTVYAVVTSTDGTVTDDTTVAGPAVLWFEVV